MSNMKRCVACGSRDIRHFIGQEQVVKHHGHERVVKHLSGYQCQESECGEIVYLNGGHERYAEACDEVVMAFRSEMQERFWHARDVLGISRKEPASFEVLNQSLLSGDEKSVDAVMTILDMMVNHSFGFQAILKKPRP